MIGQMLGLSQEDMTSMATAFTNAVALLERAVVALETTAECQRQLLAVQLISFPEPDEPDETPNRGRDTTNYDVVNYDEGDESP